MSLKTLRRTNARNRRTFDPAVPKTVTPAIAVVIDQGLSPSMVQVTFNTAVMLKGTPAWLGGAGGTATVTGATQLSATVVELTFSAATAGNPVVVPSDDPSIRTMSGGFVPAGNYTVTP